MEIEGNHVLSDLQEKRQNFKRMAQEVGSMASELRDARSRLTAQQASFARETAIRKAAEARARSMEDELQQLHKSLEEKNCQSQSSALVAEQYLRELEDARSRLAETQASAEASAAYAHSAELQCSSLLDELDKKNKLLIDYEIRVTRLEQKLDELQQDLYSREASQKHLREQVARMEHEINSAIAKAGAHKECELRKLLDEVSAKNFENLNKHLHTKEEEISRLKEEIKIMSSQWRIKTEDLEAQLEKQRRADQEHRKRVLKLEFCLHEARAQTRKLQRMKEDQARTRTTFSKPSINKDDLLQPSLIKDDLFQSNI
ncbi:nuclear envelope-associated protein 2 isoform X2 [Cryptomeria japonica]|uniref:nuclear envelope-associated protein 2 isoform X2 n=1 Tax=Cryptomeria japonica TaxID=3369 RepID=UPI0025AC0B94|nr:nuclear envelope-associated protein 2 isoform X2 [Cryptomeria japonica]